jgi:hypothetical protein
MKSSFMPATLILGLLLAMTVWAQNSATTPAVPQGPPDASSAGTKPEAPSVGAANSAASGPARPPVQQGAGGIIDGNDPLLQPPPLPPGKPTLVGGKVASVDRVKQEILVKPFGGGSMKIFFDDRTHIYRDGVETTQLGIRKGDHVYVDTLTDGGHVLAKSIRVKTLFQNADARGQVMGYRDGHLQMRDDLTSSPISFDVTPNTVIHSGGRAGSSADLLPGSLVEVRFAPGAAGQGTAKEIIIFATPGSVFTFAGKVTHLDMSSGVIVLLSRSDNRSYEVSFDPANRAYQNLGLGNEVSITAMFDGVRYDAQSVEINQRGEN